LGANKLKEDLEEVFHDAQDFIPSASKKNLIEEEKSEASK
jgi:hypothetical protein